MFKLKMGNRGVLLIMVLATILVVTILANVALNMIASQGRLTHQQVARTQAYYAALAGVNYAIEKLRVNDPAWAIPGESTHNLCNGCNGAGDINETELPASVTRVEITVGVDGTGIQGTRPIKAKAEYIKPLS